MKHPNHINRKSYSKWASKSPAHYNRKFARAVWKAAKKG